MNVFSEFEMMVRNGVSEEQAAILVLAQAVQNVAVQIKYLGAGDAATPMGAVEFLAVQVKDGFRDVASSITEVADATRS